MCICLCVIAFTHIHSYHSPLLSLSAGCYGIYKCVVATNSSPVQDANAFHDTAAIRQNEVDLVSCTMIRALPRPFPVSPFLEETIHMASWLCCPRKRLSLFISDPISVSSHALLFLQWCAGSALGEYINHYSLLQTASR